MQYVYTDQESVEFGSMKLKPFMRVESTGDSRMADAHVVSFMPMNRAEMPILCVPSDLLYYNSPTAPTNVDIPHRYFHPPATNGVEIMLKTPKITLTRFKDSTAGEVMCITWFFWTSWKHLGILGSPAPSSMHTMMADFATEIVQTYEPIPDTPWEPPILAPLPFDFESLSGPERIKALLKRA